MIIPDQDGKHVIGHVEHGDNMILKEFFGPAIRINNLNKSQKDEDNHDDLFWFLVNHNKLHKDYFFPAAKRIKDQGSCDEKEIYELFMPMVNKGCMEYYKVNEMTGKMKKQFPEKMREDLCKKLYDHYHDDINKNVYRIGK